MPQLAGHRVTVYSFIASGYTTYATELQMMHKAGQLDDIDHVIISETFEPRWSLLRANAHREIIPIEHCGVTVELWRYRAKDYLVMSYYPDVLRDTLVERYGLGVRDDLTEFISDVECSISVPASVEISHEYMRRLLTDMGIPITLISWNYPVMPADGNTVVRLMDHVYDELLRPDPSTRLTFAPGDKAWPHQTREGNRVIGAKLSQLLGDRI